MKLTLILMGNWHSLWCELTFIVMWNWHSFTVILLVPVHISIHIRIYTDNYWKHGEKLNDWHFVFIYPVVKYPWYRPQHNVYRCCFVKRIYLLLNKSNKVSLLGQIKINNHCTRIFIVLRQLQKKPSKPDFRSFIDTAIYTIMWNVKTLMLLKKSLWQVPQGSLFILWLYAPK